MLKKIPSILALSSLLLTSSAYAQPPNCNDCHNPEKKNAAALHYTVSKTNSPETTYWNDFIGSGNKDITVYVRDLSRTDARAALWFITTGGKHGFSARQATAQERGLLEDAIKQVAISYGRQGANANKGLQEWSQVSQANNDGHLHIQMIYQQLDNLNIEVFNLKTEVKLLKAAQAKTDRRQTALENDLKVERVARTRGIDKLIESIPSLLKPATDEIKAILEASETKWATIVAKWDVRDAQIDKDREEREILRAAAITEKTAYEKKITDNKAEADRILAAQKIEADAKLEAQKVKRRKYKKDLNEFNAQENKNKLDAKDEALRQANEAARQANEAAVNALRQANEAAAERERKMQEKMDAMVAAFSKGVPLSPSMNAKLFPNGNNNSAPNSPTITINGANK